MGLTLILTLVRIAMIPWTNERAPYAFVFVAVVGAAVLAGWRSGIIALVLGQAMAWYFVADPQMQWTGKDDAELAALAVASVSEFVALAIVVLYQREVDRARSQRESQMGLLEKALREIDHRTSNNYQTVLALVLAQAKSAENDAVRDALQQVADRIRAIANASRRLAVASQSLEQVRIDEHLHGLCDEIERGLARPGIALQCSFDDAVLDADDTVAISVLVNELVTNSLKHAFPGGRAGTINVKFANSRSSHELVVEDDGVGLDGGKETRGTGLGTRLVETFVGQLGAKHEVSSGAGGTSHRIRIPR